MMRLRRASAGSVRTRGQDSRQLELEQLALAGRCDRSPTYLEWPAEQTRVAQLQERRCRPDVWVGQSMLGSLAQPP